MVDLNTQINNTVTFYTVTDGTSKRKEMKELIKTMKQVNSNVDQNIFKALDNVNLDCILGTKKDKVYQNFLEEYEK